MIANHQQGQFVGTVTIVMSVVVLTVVLWWFLPIAQSHHDVSVFQGIGARVWSVWQGENVRVTGEYTPLAAVLFGSITILSEAIGLSFMEIWPWVLWSLLITTLFYIWWRGGKNEVEILAVSLAVTAILFNGDMMYARYDILIGLTILLGWLSWRRENYKEGMWWLVIAAALKIVPVLLLPLLILGVNKRESRVGWLVGIATMVACLPLLLLGWNNIKNNMDFLVTYHTERGIQLESTWSGTVMLIRAIERQPAILANHHGAIHNEGVDFRLTIVALILIIMGVIIIYVAQMLLAKKEEELAPMAIAVMLWAIALSPVLSPQYFLWVMPLLIGWLWMLAKEKRLPVRVGLAVVIGGSLIGLLTQKIILHDGYSLLMNQSLISVVILNMRNLLLFGLLWGVVAIWWHEKGRIGAKSNNKDA